MLQGLLSINKRPTESSWVVNTENWKDRKGDAIKVDAVWILGAKEHGPTSQHCRCHTCRRCHPWHSRIPCSGPGTISKSIAVNSPAAPCSEPCYLQLVPAVTASSPASETAMGWAPDSSCWKQAHARSSPVCRRGWCCVWSSAPSFVSFEAPPWRSPKSRPPRRTSHHPRRALWSTSRNSTTLRLLH